MKFFGLNISWNISCNISEIFQKSVSVFTRSLDSAKRSFYRAFNSLFGKIGRIASEDVNVIVQLLKTKCLPVLYYCLEACPQKKAQL